MARIIADAVHVEASPSRVWAVTVDVERWPEWSPTVQSVVRMDPGPFGVGSTARIKQPGQPLSRWTVTEFVAGERFVWETRRPGLRMIATHELSAQGAGTTSELRLEVAGTLAGLLWPILRFAVRRALDRENRGLKARCEARL